MATSELDLTQEDQQSSLEAKQGAILDFVQSVNEDIDRPCKKKPALEIILRLQLKEMPVCTGMTERLKRYETTERAPAEAATMKQIPRFVGQYLRNRSSYSFLNAVF